MMSDLFGALALEMLRFDLSGQFMCLILMAFMGFVLRLLLRGPGDAWVQSASSMLLSTGVLGTFAGVVVSLSNLNISQIDDKIGDVLAGLSTAFYSSLLAMTLSLVFKAVQVRALQRLRERDDVEASNDIAEKLLLETSNSVKQLRQLNITARENSEYLIHITNAVADGSDSSGLLGQMALQRQQAEQATEKWAAEITQLRHQGGDTLTALMLLHEQQQTLSEARKLSEEERKRQFDSLQQILMTLPSRRDFRALSSVIADRVAPVAPASGPLRGVRL